MSDTITGYIEMPFCGESAYQIAKRYGFTGTEEEWVASIGSVNDKEMEKVLSKVGERMCDYTWYVDTDEVKDKKGQSYGTLAQCMTDNFVGTWFFVRTTQSEAGFAQYSESYAIDGANGWLSLRDYVVWTGAHLVHIPTFEAKGSTVKNTDGKYSPQSGVDGLMSSTDKAYLTDIINKYWNKDMLRVYTSNVHECNKLLDTGVYVGGFLTDCEGHPPYTDGNTTNWVMIVLNNYANETNPNNHRVQIAIDLSNHLVYLRKGWISSGGWGDTWTDINKKGAEKVSDVVITDGEATVKLEENTKEIVARGAVNLKVLLPENPWGYWRCIINLFNADTVEGFDVGISTGDMFGRDVTWSIPEAGKTYMLVKNNDGSDAPTSYDLHEIDNLTRQIV